MKHSKAQRLLGSIALLSIFLVPCPAVANEIAALLPGMVKISTTKDGSSTTGTGFVVGLDGNAAFVLTAAHVIAGGRQTRVVFYQSNFKAYPVQSVRMDETSDLAALWIPNPPAGLEIFKFGREDQLQPGDLVHVIGFSRQATAPRVINGSLSGFEGSLLVVNPGVEEGTSGAPLLYDGKVAGVVVKTENRFAQAVPAVTVRFVLEQWRVPFVLERKRRTPSDSRQESAPAPPPPPQGPGAYPCAGKIAFKTGASQPIYPTTSRSQSIGKIPEGTSVEILHDADNSGQRWYKVRYGQLEGWISGAYIDLSSQCPR